MNEMEKRIIYSNNLSEYENGRLNVLIELYLSIKEEPEPIKCATIIVRKINEMTGQMKNKVCNEEKPK